MCRWPQSRVANELNTNQLARWCREHLTAQGQPRAPAIVAVRVAPPSVVPVELTAPERAVCGEIEWRHGQSIVVVRGSVDESALRWMLAHVKPLR